MIGDQQVRAYTSAGGVVIDGTGQHVLTLLRSGRLDPTDRPEVRLPKGHIEPNESPLQTALREVAEETGITALVILAKLGQQIVEFDWRDAHYVRQELYYLMTPARDAVSGHPEEQFARLWLTWEEAMDRVSYEAEREWLRRARKAWIEITVSPVEDEQE